MKLLNESDNIVCEVVAHMIEWTPWKMLLMNLLHIWIIVVYEFVTRVTYLLWNCCAYDRLITVKKVVNEFVTHMNSCLWICYERVTICLWNCCAYDRLITVKKVVNEFVTHIWIIVVYEFVTWWVTILFMNLLHESDNIVYEIVAHMMIEWLPWKKLFRNLLHDYDYDYGICYIVVYEFVTWLVTTVFMNLLHDERQYCLWICCAYDHLPSLSEVRLWLWLYDL
jgi:hypothetical protein